MFDPEKSRFQKRSLNLLRHKTSVSLEKAFWEVLEEAARKQHISVTQLIQKVDEKRMGNLASALRLHGLFYALGEKSQKESKAIGDKGCDGKASHP
jgi:predicted DNA-binding ribbon-helix-helix protein